MLFPFVVVVGVVLNSLGALAETSSSAIIGADLSALRSQLSSGASISLNTSSAPRWSDYDAPKPVAIVNVATEKDVQTSIQFCNSKNISYLVQNGAHGWSTTLGRLHDNGVIINLAALINVTFNADKSQVTVQGGTLTSHLIETAYSQGALVPVGTCNCVGVMGALLGAGVGYLMGQYGLGLDNLVSLNVVLASGEAVTVTPDDSDLWWALRGAGPNFGAVTSAVMNSYPVNSSGLDAWIGPLVFTESQFGDLIQAMNDLTLEPEMAMSLTLASSGNASVPPSILLTVFYHGTEAQGKAAFASIYEIGPVEDNTAILPYTEWNAAQDVSCSKGGNKPSFGAGLADMNSEAWQTVYDAYKDFVSNPEAEYSVILLDAYPTAKMRSFPDSTSSYPFRSTVRFNAQASLSWTNSSFDTTALEFGSKCRDIWRSTSGLQQNSTYINNGFGDESLQTVYGQSLERLQTLKTKYDPEGRFDYWFPLDGYKGR